MTVEELYSAIGGDYEAAKRILMMDSMIAKFLPMLADDTSLSRLESAWANKDNTGMFEASHSMKGVCANLGLSGLSEKASEICEQFRPGKERTLTDEQIDERMASLKAQFDLTLEQIRLFGA